MGNTRASSHGYLLALDLGVQSIGWGVLGTGAKSEREEAETREEQDAAHDKAVIADIVSFGGAAIAVAGIVWGIVHIAKKEKPAPEPESARIYPIVDENSAGVGAAFTF